MSLSTRKMGFWSVFSIVVGSQIGSGVFMLPAALAPYGHYSLWGWAIAGSGAVLLALVFSSLCIRFPRTGGPHVYVQRAFGDTLGFFTSFTYWVVSWVSTTAVVITGVSYLTPLIGHHGVLFNVMLELSILGAVCYLNTQGVGLAGFVECILNNIKIIPLLVIPACALYFFKADHMEVATQMSAQTCLSLLSSTTLLCLWGFIGLETATTPAGSIQNPHKTIPKAVIWGTLCVAFIYLFNSIGIMGSMPGADLAKSQAPYVDVARFMLGDGPWSLAISLIGAFVCLGTLNAWVLSASQVALGACQDTFFHKKFEKRNKKGAPSFGIIASSLGTAFLIILTANANFAHQINTIIDISTISFLFIYALCCLSFLKVLKEEQSFSLKEWGYGVLGLLFSVWIIISTPIETVLYALSFTIVGIPFYCIRRYYRQKNRDYV